MPISVRFKNRIICNTIHERERAIIKRNKKKWNIAKAKINEIIIDINETAC